MQRVGQIGVSKTVRLWDVTSRFRSVRRLDSHTCPFQVARAICQREYATANLVCFIPGDAMIPRTFAQN
jgi:hypothetical protein